MENVGGGIGQDPATEVTNLGLFVCLFVCLFVFPSDSTHYRGTGASPAGTAAAGPMLEAKLMNLIKARLQKF